MKGGRFWVLLAAIAIWLLDDAYVRSHPGAVSLAKRDGLLPIAVGVTVLGLVAWGFLPVLWAKIRKAAGHEQVPFFAPDPTDAEQAAADAELERIGDLTDEDEYARAWNAWLVGERRREEARFVRRRERAQVSRDETKRYVKEVRAELEFERSMLDPKDPEDSTRDDVRRLEEELAWAQAELERMAPT